MGSEFFCTNSKNSKKFLRHSNIFFADTEKDNDLKLDTLSNEPFFYLKKNRKLFLKSKMSVKIDFLKTMIKIDIFFLNLGKG